MESSNHLSFAPTRSWEVNTLPFQTRKPNRLRSYDYSQNGAYFLTVCTQDKRCVLWNGREPQVLDPADTSHLSMAGQAADAAIKGIPLHYPGTVLDKYVVMPNHIHAILLLSRTGAAVPSVSQIIRQMKCATARLSGPSLWQKSFHDHIIRDEAEYQKIWTYIDLNPIRWREDCYFSDD